MVIPFRQFQKKARLGVLRGAHRSSLEEATKWERERSIGSPPISGAQSDTSLQLRRNHAGSTKQDKLVRYREGALMSLAVVLGKVGCSISGSVGSVAQVPNDFFP